MITEDADNGLIITEMVLTMRGTESHSRLEVMIPPTKPPVSSLITYYVIHDTIASCVPHFNFSIIVGASTRFDNNC